MSKPVEAQLQVIREGASLRPRSAFDAQLIERFPTGVPLVAEVRERRTQSKNREYWGVLQIVVNATGKWPDVESLHWAMKLHLGYVEEIATVDGEIVIRPRSTSFASMDETEFREFLSRALDEICTNLLPGFDPQELWNLGKQMMEAK